MLTIFFKLVWVVWSCQVADVLAFSERSAPLQIQQSCRLQCSNMRIQHQCFQTDKTPLDESRFLTNGWNLTRTELAQTHRGALCLCLACLSSLILITEVLSAGKFQSVVFQASVEPWKFNQRSQHLSYTTPTTFTKLNSIPWMVSFTPKGVSVFNESSENWYFFRFWNISKLNHSTLKSSNTCSVWNQSVTVKKYNIWITACLHKLNINRKMTSNVFLLLLFYLIWLSWCLWQLSVSVWAGP